MRAVLVCALLCAAAAAGPARDRLGDSGAEAGGVAYHDSSGRVSHRVQLLFPLLLRISSRLATLVSAAMMGLAGISLLVAFSKKALIVSLLALFLTYLDRRGPGQRDEEEVVHIHRVEDLHRLTHDLDHFRRVGAHFKSRPHAGSLRKRYRVFPRFPVRAGHRIRRRIRSLREDQPSPLRGAFFGLEPPLGGCNQTMPSDRMEAEV